MTAPVPTAKVSGPATPATEQAEVKAAAAPVPTTPAKPEVPAKRLVGKPEDLPAMAQVFFGTAITMINTANDIIRKNSAQSRGLDEIVAELTKNSTDANVVTLREQISTLQEKMSNLLLDEAKTVKANAGEPDGEAEKKALDSAKVYRTAFLSLPELADLDVSAILPSLPTGSGAAKGVTASKASNDGGAKNDLSTVRDWARQNGHEVGERGRISQDILDAYKKANPTAA